MGRLINSEAFKKNKAMLAMLTYLLTAIFFFPLSFILWYLSNRGKVSIYSSFAAMLAISAISTSSYLYVIKPLASYHMNFGIYGTIIYGGLFSVIFFSSRYTFPANTTVICWMIYYFSYVILIMSTISWTVIPRYYLSHGIDNGSVLLSMLGVSWFFIIMLINKYNPPIDEGIVSLSPRHIKIILALVAMLALCTCALSWLILYVSQRLL